MILDIKVIRSIYQLIKDTTSSFDKIQKAQLMLPLHLRKSNAEKNIFGVFFREMVSIKLVDGLDIFKQEAKCLFVQLIANEHIRNIIRGFQRNKWFRF